MKKHQIKAFTLVELIIVITILAILATIWFLSFQDYTRDARDANRLATLKNIQKGLLVYNTKAWIYPSPESPYSVSLSGVLISNQGTFWDTQAKIINMTSTPLDPLDNTKYYYATGKNDIGYKLMWYMENSEIVFNSIINKTYAIDYVNRVWSVIWQWPAILLDETNAPISTNVDIFLSWSNNLYTALIDDKISVTWSWINIWWWLQMLASKWWNFAAPNKCSDWFIPVSGNPEFSQPGFCIMKYEASYDDLSVSNVTWLTTWNTRKYDSLKNPLSLENRLPITEITQQEAIDSCKKIGWHLVTNNEWMTVARNIENQSINWSNWITWSWFIYNWVSNETTLWMWCDWKQDWTNFAWETWSSYCSKKRQLVLSNWEKIWDFAWNVWEHVNKANTINWENYSLWLFEVDTSFKDEHNIWWSSNDILSNIRSNYWPLNSQYNHSSNWVWNIYWIWTDSISNNIFLRWWNADIWNDTWLYSIWLYWSSNSSWHSSVWFRCAK